MSEKNPPERLVFFTDAVVAIALTLLVLPLTDIVPDLVATHARSIQVFTDHQWQIRSFLVIGRQWLSHHRLFGQVTAFSTHLFFVNMAWLLTVVVMPFSTQMVGGFGADKFACLFYIGTMVANSLCLTWLVSLVRRDPQLTGGRSAVSARWWVDSVGTTVSLMAAFVIAALVPSINYFAILLVLVPSIVIKAARLDRVVATPDDLDSRAVRG
ncbi:MAG TPA: TMEM175 family protein [Pseudonocardiaceae bacterium]|nr:TMEM175 family protein [Pseudonocardiaceae bacterium]